MKDKAPTDALWLAAINAAQLFHLLSSMQTMAPHEQEMTLRPSLLLPSALLV
jgi:hypothetical protein